MNSLNVLVAGGGIGGLTVALCLAQYGHRISVFEPGRNFDEVGAGIQLSPNCTRVLHHLGLEPAIRAEASLPQATHFRHWATGKLIAQSALGADAVKRYGMPYYHIHRGDLMRVLADAAAEHPNIILYTDARVEALSQHHGYVEVVVSGKSHQGEVLIGADGIHSVVRATLWGEEAPRFTGNIAWRALVPSERLSEGLIQPTATVWWGSEKHFVHYYVRSGTLVNCVGVVEKDGWKVESWTEPGELADLASDYSGWHHTIEQLIENVNTDSLFKWALFDRVPMPRWSQGRVTLLGDACHPTLPFMAQGAAMAIEDSAVLAACLKLDKEIPARLEQYEKLRHKRTANIQSGSRRNAKLFHLSGWKAWIRNQAVGVAQTRMMDSLYSYNALEALNSQP